MIHRYPLCRAISGQLALLRKSTQPLESMIAIAIWVHHDSMAPQPRKGMGICPLWASNRWV